VIGLFACPILFAVLVSPPASPAGNSGIIDPASEAASDTLYIREYRVTGARHLPRLQVEEAVYPFLGPGRTREDVEQARAALEKIYHAAGYQTVTVEIPPQEGRGGIVFIRVTEATVGRLRVKGARYFSPAAIKAMAPSLAEGRVVNFNEVPGDILALDQIPDRQVTPTLRAGAVPGTVDIDLNVKDRNPVHESLELNNRYSPNTTPLRVNASLGDTNLWQLGHAAGLSFQVAPERSSDAKVFSGYYLAHVANAGGLGLMLEGTKQDSDISTLGGAGVAGRGETVGLRALVSLPPAHNFYESASLGIDYKHYDQDVHLAGSTLAAPVSYVPLSGLYSATWAAPGRTTEVNLGLNLGLREIGSDSTVFDNRRYGADADFIYFRGDVSRTRDLPGGFQFFAKAQGQLADQPLVDAEEFSGGGLYTARGYLESEALGDNGLFGTVEVRSPSLRTWAGPKVNEWRIYVFSDAGRLTVNDPLPEQVSAFDLVSWGVGSRIRLLDDFNGSLDAGFPLTNLAPTKAGDVLLTFRVWADF